ncbi:MAG: MopE-related protein [Desulfobacteraceae bacterium]|jgi:hypothetical protein|nr:MopE-related protein [Desulfobacteraceae bacterium]
MKAFKYFLSLMVLISISFFSINVEAVVWDIDADGKHSLPDVIYMLQSLSGVIPPPVEGVLYIESSTTNGSTVFTDESPKAHTVTANGDVQHDYPFGLDSAILFDGTGDYLSVADSDDWDFGTDDFTIDLWVNYTVVPSDNSNGIFGTGTWPIAGIYRYAMKINNGTLSWYDPFTGWVDTGVTPVADTWYHLAVVRSGDTLSIYVNGSETITADCAGIAINSADTGVAIGRATTNLDGLYFNGYMDEIRITKGEALWTADFTPPNYPGCPPDSDTDGDGFTPAEGDCNCNNAQIYPGATEVCGDGIDQDCNGSDLDCPVETWTGNLTSSLGGGTGSSTQTFTKVDGVITVSGLITVQDPTYGEFVLPYTGAAVSMVGNTLTVTPTGTATQTYSGQTSAFTSTTEGTFFQGSASGTFSVVFTGWGYTSSGTWTAVLVSGSGITN